MLRYDKFLFVIYKVVQVKWDRRFGFFKKKPIFGNSFQTLMYMCEPVKINK